jgi:hypothetical protein
MNRHRDRSLWSARRVVALLARHASSHLGDRHVRLLVHVVLISVFVALAAHTRSADTAVAATCAPGYVPCLPVVSDLNCADIPPSKRPVRVTGADQYELDRDGDGIACEEGATGPPPQAPAPSQGCTLAGVMPSAAKAYYDTRSAVSRAAAGGPVLRGLCASAKARFADKGTGRPWALVSVYRYRSATAATDAVEALCPAVRCSKSTSGATVGIRLRFRQEPPRSGAKCFGLVGVRQAVVVTVATCAAVDDKGKPYGLSKLKYDASYLVGLLHARAR